MKTWFQNVLFRVRFPYAEVERQNRAGLLMQALQGHLVLILAALIYQALVALLNPPLPTGWLEGTLVTLVLLALAYSAVQFGYLAFSTWVITLGLLLMLFIVIIQRSPNDFAAFQSPAIFLLIIPLLVAGMVMPRREFLVIAILLTLLILTGFLSHYQAKYSANNLALTLIVGDWFVISIVIFIITSLMLVYWNTIHKIQVLSATDLTFRRRINNFWERITLQENSHMAIQDIYQLLRQEMGYSFIQVLQLDDEGNFSNAVRQILGNLEVVPAELLKIGGASALIECIHRRQSIQISRQDAQGRREHFLPTTHYGVVVPIIQANQLLGVLDVQTNAEQNFQPPQVQLIELLAAQLGAALLHIEQQNTLQTLLNEQQTLNNRLQTQIADLQHQQQRSANEAWINYVEGRGAQALGYNLETLPSGGQFVVANDLPEHLQQVIRAGKVHLETSAHQHTISIPIRFRDQTLGAMSFRVPLHKNVNQRQIDTAQSIADRLASALENTRLFEQTQSQAQRERKAGEISNLLISAMDVRSMLNTAVENFNEALGAVHTEIHIQLLETPAVGLDLQTQES